METYFAPMEGITGYIFRRVHHDCFGGVDAYYMPFLTPKPGKGLTGRELKDVLPEHNRGMRAVPQILTNRAEGFLETARRLKELGYCHVNLNLGCPFGTVVAKKKGSGFLAFPGELDTFLERVFAGTDMDISVKTRIGKEDAEEFYALLEIFNKYPIKKLIVHPRLQTDFYQNSPNLDMFSYALSHSKNPVCYNGDLFTVSDLERFGARFPEVESIMLGRGMLVNPGLMLDWQQNRGGDLWQPSCTKERLYLFLERICREYGEVLCGERDVLFKMKELWFYVGKLFVGGDKELKMIRKAQRMAEYEDAVRRLFGERELRIPHKVQFLGN